MSLSRFGVAVLACLAAWLAATPTSAAVVDAGRHFLAPNAAGQQVDILVTGGDAVAGLDLFVQIGDGGAAAGGDDTGPMITGVDLTTGGIFAANNSGVFLDPTPLLWGATIATTSGTVAAAGKLATLTVDTTGLTEGRFDLILNPPATGPTQLAGASTTLTNGWLQIGASLGADFSGTGGVTAADLAIWQAGYGTGVTQPAGDADADEDVDGADFLTWQQQLGSGAPGVAASVGALAAVPEPSAVVLAASFAAGLAPGAARRRRACPRTSREIGW